MKKKLAIALCLAAIAASAEARPMADYWCDARHHIVTWADKSKSKAETAYGIILHDTLIDRKNPRWRFDGEDRDKNWKRLPSRLFRWVGDSENGYLTFKGKRCVGISYTTDGLQCLKPDGTPEPCELRRAQ